MTQDDVIRLAREAGFEDFDNWSRHYPNETKKWCERMEAFAKLVAEHEREHYDHLFEQIKGWCEAYPIAVFPEPDFKKAHEVLKANGMTLDSISASNMKHVITQVQQMIDAAIRARGQA